jgi:AraC-like DNA-binding protein
LHSRAPWLDRRPLNRIAGTSPLNGALRFYLERLAGPACPSVVEAAALTENICNILALLTATSDSERSSARQFAITPGLDEMLAVLRLHLANPDLAPKMLAERLGVSVRTIHKRFEDSNTTIGQWILENRLQACRGALGDPRHASFTISEIAYGWGFNDLSHFSKAFKARFGLSPARYRHANRTTDQA